MATIDMPPEDMSPHTALDTKQQVRTPLISEAKGRIRARLAFVLSAVDDFADASVHHIDDHLKDYEHEDAAFGFGPVVDGMITAVGTVLFPEGEFAKIVFEAASKIMVEGLEHAVEAGRTDVKGAKAKLHDAVRAFSVEMRRREMHANDELMAHIEHTCDLALAQVEDVSHSEEWITAMCDWMGITEPSQATIYDPIRQWLEYEFVGLLARVQAEVAKEHGIPGISSNEISPNAWEHDARVDEQNRYNHAHSQGEREEAWEETYKMSE
jgi:hypothetical protein